MHSLLATNAALVHEKASYGQQLAEAETECQVGMQSLQSLLEMQMNIHGSLGGYLFEQKADFGKSTLKHVEDTFNFDQARVIKKKSSA